MAVLGKVIPVFALTLSVAAFLTTPRNADADEGDTCIAKQGPMYEVETCCNCTTFGEGIICHEVLETQQNPGPQWEGFLSCSSSLEGECPDERDCDFGGGGAN
jgi:hypothetical protein